MWKNRAVQVSLVKKNDNTTPDVENAKTDPQTIAKIAGGMIKETLIVAAIGVGALIVLNAACQIAENALKADDK
jgi:hypothetical protein